MQESGGVPSPTSFIGPCLSVLGRGGRTAWPCLVVRSASSNDGVVPSRKDETQHMAQSFSRTAGASWATVGPADTLSECEEHGAVRLPSWRPPMLPGTTARARQAPQRPFDGDWVLCSGGDAAANSGRRAQRLRPRWVWASSGGALHRRSVQGGHLWEWARFDHNINRCGADFDRYRPCAAHIWWKFAKNGRKRPADGGKLLNRMTTRFGEYSFRTTSESVRRVSPEASAAESDLRSIAECFVAASAAPSLFRGIRRGKSRPWDAIVG